MAQQRHGNVSPDVDDAGQKVRGFDPGLCCYFFCGKALVVLALVDGREQMCFGWPEKRTLFYDIAWLETVQTVNLHNRKLIDCAEARDFKRARNESPFALRPLGGWCQGRSWFCYGTLDCNNCPYTYDKFYLNSLAPNALSLALPSGPPDGLRFSASKTFTSPIVSGASAECVPSLALSMSRRKRPASQTSRASARASSAAETSEFASQRNERLVESVRGILATRNLTLYEVAARSRSDYPGRPRYHIPANLYFRLRSGNWTPTLYQLSVLRKMSEYHLADWLSVFGFPPDAISRVQATLRRPRTILLDSTLYDLRATISWFRERQAKRAIPSVAALSEIL